MGNYLGMSTWNMQTVRYLKQRIAVEDHLSLKNQTDHRVCWDGVHTAFYGVLPPSSASLIYRALNLTKTVGQYFFFGCIQFVSF